MASTPHTNSGVRWGERGREERGAGHTHSVAHSHTNMVAALPHNMQQVNTTFLLTPVLTCNCRRREGSTSHTHFNIWLPKASQPLVWDGDCSAITRSLPPDGVVWQK